MNGVQKVIKYCAMAFAIFLSVMILGSIIAVVGGVATGIAGANVFENKERIDLAESYTAEEVKSLGITSVLIDCNAEITVEQGEVLSIEATNVTDEYEIRCAGGKFSIVQDTPNINFKWVWFDDVTVKETVVVTLPADFCPEQVKICSGSGRVALEQVDTEELIIDSGSGRVIADVVQTDKLYVDSGSGSVFLANAKATNSELYTGSGSVSVEESDLGKFKLDTGSGSVRMENVVARNAEIDTGSGSVVIDGALTGTCEFETGSGSLTIRLDGEEEDYRVKADCGSGTFRINGKKVDDGSYGTNRKGELIIDSGSGSVNVEFNTPEEE